MENRYKNILIIVLGLLVFYYYNHHYNPQSSLYPYAQYFLYAAMAVGILSAFIPVVAKYIDWFWLKLATVLGWINSRILLSILFFIFLFPLALISRLFTKDPLGLKNNNSSLYNSRSHKYTKKDLENIW